MKTNLRPRVGYSVSSAAWSNGGVEPPLKEMLADPIIRAVMRNLRRTYRIEGANLAPKSPEAVSLPQSGA